MRLSCVPSSHLLYLNLLLLGYGSLGVSARVDKRAFTSPGASSNSSTTSSNPVSSLDTSIVVEVLTATIQPLPSVSTTSTQSDDQVNLQYRPAAANGPDDEVNVSNTSPGKNLPTNSQSNNGQPTKTSATNPHSSSESPKSSSSSTSSIEKHDSKSSSGKSSQNPSRTSAPPTTYTNEQVTITSAPNWGDQKIPINTCTTLVNDREIQWIPCMVFAGTVQLSFFPEAVGNLSYPSTYFDPALGITLTSPSIYMIINTLTAYNPCGRVGPTYKDYILSMDLTDVSSLRPYPDATARDRLGDPRQLTLADLATNCPKFSDTPEGQTLIHSAGAIIDEHPVENDWNRCNPRLVMPDQMKSVGLPYWRHCGNDNGHFGIFDPPGAVPPVQGIFPTKAADPITPAPVVTPTAQPSPTIPPSPPPTAIPVAPEPQPEAEKPKTSQQPNAVPTLAPTAIMDPKPSPSNPDLVVPINQDTTPTPPKQSGSESANSGDQPVQQNPNNQPVGEIAQQPSAIVVIGSNTIHAGTSGIIIPGAPQASIGAVATLTDSNNNGVIVSVGSSGIYVGTGASASFIANPTSPPLVAPIAGVPTPIATLGGEIIQAIPGATTLVVKGQTLTAGGPPVTISGTENVAILGHNGLIIQYPGGTASYFPLPTAAPAQINVSTDGSTIVYEGKTLSVGGPPATIADGAVASLGPSGVVIQRPSGTESTISLSQLTGAASPNRNKAEDDSMGVIIAGIMGIQPAQPQGGSTSPIGVISATSLLGNGLSSLSAISENTKAPSATGSNIKGTITAAIVGGTFHGSPPPTVSTRVPGGNTTDATATDAPTNLQASSGTRMTIWGGRYMAIVLVAVLVL